jgi:hypothetical protein
MMGIHRETCVRKVMQQKSRPSNELYKKRVVPPEGTTLKLNCALCVIRVKKIVIVRGMVAALQFSGRLCL